MSRLTITLDDDLHRALRESAARRDCTINKIIEESLLLRGIKPVESARQLVARARQHAGLTETDAMDIAVEETRTVRSA
jgi:predicted transcriptional regulator